MGFFDKLFGKKPLPPRPSFEEVRKQVMTDARAFMTGEGLLELGILFDVAQLGGGFYGHQAYKIFFANLDPQRLKGCMLHDGDALAISSDIYCICVQTTKQEQIDYVRQTMSGVEAPGLLPAARRFATGRVAAPNYLVHSGFVDPEGAFNVKKNGMIGESWADGTAWTIYQKL
jgi:hypothetical protein